MKLTPTLPAIVLGLALSLSACSGEAATTQSDDDAEATEETVEEAASEQDASSFAEDQTGGLVSVELLSSLNEKLAGFHTDSGSVVHLITAMTTDGRDIEEVAEEMRTEREADALIFVAGADQALAIVGEGLDEDFTSETELAMIAHFEEDELVEGLNAGADALIARLGN